MMKSQLLIILLLLASLALFPGLSLTDSDDNDLSSGSPVRTDRLGPPPTLTPFWHESDGAWIEMRRGRRVWIHNLDASVSANMTDDGIHLQMLNQQGEPAVSAWVEAYPLESEWPEWYGYTNQDGQAEVIVPDGAWTLTAASWRDHFVIAHEGITAPGSLTLDTTGTVSVEVTARRLDGQPLSGALVSFDRFTGGIHNDVGDTDSEGHLHADALPGTYCGLAASWDERYNLNRRGITVTDPTDVAFDATLMGTGQVLMRLSGPAEMGLSMFPEPRCRSTSPVFSMADGETTVLSADRYQLGLDRELTDINDTSWLFYYNVKDTPHDILPGSLTTVWAGGTHAASVTPGQATYPPGARVYLNQRVVDGFENRLRQISRGPEQEVVLAHIVVRGPQGSIVYEGGCWLSSVCTFALAHDAVQGRYEVEWTLDTGPLQGVLHATTDFLVGGSPATPTPTETAKATPTSTCTPLPTATTTPTATSTSTPTSAWRLYLPLIRKEAP
ncbi:MAG: hypothetical protein WBW48_18660 [Anaerolineae bacterium]